MAARNFRALEPARQAARLALDEHTRLHPNDWSSVEVRVRNLSATGFRADCEARLPVGSCVAIDLPGLGALAAQIEWQRGDSLGAKFLEPIETERCAWIGYRRGAGRVGLDRELRARIAPPGWKADMS